MAGARGGPPGESPPRASIYVLAGVNGAGKSSLLGENVRARGGRYFNPDEVARRIVERYPERGQRSANAAAWQIGVNQLARALAANGTYAFETTLGGATVARLLRQALAEGHAVFMQHVGVSGADLHVARVRARVASGGHDIPEEKIRERYTSSRTNLIALLPYLTTLELYDNTAEAPLGLGAPPVPMLLLRVERGAIVEMLPGTRMPEWARSIVMAALKKSRAAAPARKRPGP